MIMKITIITGIFIFLSIQIITVIYAQPTPAQEKLAFNDDGEKKSYTDCMGYRAYTEYKGISRYEADFNTSAVDERIEAIQLGQEQGTTGPVSEEELVCLQAIRAVEKNTLNEIVEKAGGFDDLIENNNKQLELLKELY